MINFLKFLLISTFFLSFPNFLIGEEIPKIKINLPAKTYVSLKQQKLRAENNKIIEYKPKKLRMILIDESKHKYLGNISLDGLGFEHFRYNEVIDATLKLKLKKNNNHFKFSEFRLIDPRAAYYDVPFLYNLLLEYFKLPSRKTSIFEVTFNHSQINKVKILEESFGKNFIDKNFLRQGLIFKISIYNKKGHNALAKSRKKKMTHEEYMNVFYQNINALNLSKFDSKNDNELENLQKKYAFDLFKQYLNKEKEAHEVFDIDTTVKHFFINSLLGDMHTILAHNIRFYFNPINEKFFLIPSDPVYPISNKKYNKIPLPFILDSDENSVLLNYYNQDLEREWFNNLINDDIFKSSYLNLLLNLQRLDLTSLISNIDGYPSKFEENLNRNSKEIIKGNINHIINLMSETKNKEFVKKKLDILKPRTKKKLLSNNLLVIDHEKKLIKFRDNYKIVINQVLDIGKEYKNYTLVINPGSTIILKEGSFLKFNSKVRFLGNKKAPIRFYCQGESCNIKFINNILVKMNHVSFANFKHDTSKSFHTSPITFYNSSIDLDNVNFSNFYSEDQLNIVDSTFKITNSTFINSYSDMIDIDNSKGYINNINLENCGNDCLDFSSSQVNVENINILNSIDKGISVGEKSNIKIKNGFLSNCGKVCIASKDSSKLYLDNIYMENSLIGVTSYNKKNIFDYGEINILNSIKHKNIKHIFIQEKKNSIKTKMNSKIVLTDNLDKYIKKK